MYLIGIVGRPYKNKDGNNIIQTHDRVRRLFMKYNDICTVTILPTEDIDYLENTGGIDKINKEKISFILDKCDAIVMPGGSYSFNFDEYIIDYAYNHNKPLLCICLGFQTLCNHYALNRTKHDMTLRKDLPLHMGDGLSYKHKVIIKDNNLLRDILNKDEIMTNSSHHNIVDFELKELVPIAYAEDNVLEAVYMPNKKFMLGLQWHPEILYDENDKKIIDAFLEAMKED